MVISSYPTHQPRCASHSRRCSAARRVAAAPPSRVACARLALEWLLVPTLAAGLCLPAVVCCSALPSAAFSVARVEAVRALRAWAGGGGARPRTEVRRGAAPLSGAIADVAPAAAASGGEAAAPLPHATAKTVSSLPQKPPSHADASPPYVATPTEVAAGGHGGGGGGGEGQVVTICEWHEKLPNVHNCKSPQLCCFRLRISASPICFPCPLLVFSFPVLRASAPHEKLCCCFGLTLSWLHDGVVLRARRGTGGSASSLT